MNRQQLRQQVVAVTLIMLMSVGCVDGAVKTLAIGAAVAGERQLKEPQDSAANGPQSQPLRQCQRIIAPGRYHLTLGLVGAPVQTSPPLDEPGSQGGLFDRACLEIASSDVTLDCRGNAVTATAEQVAISAGISLAGRAEAPLHDVHVENCQVTGHQIGIYAEHVTRSSILNSQASRNAHAGFFLFGASDTTVAGNIAERNGVDGILIANGNEVTVSDNLALYNRMRGITVDQDSEGCTIHNNESAANGVLGFAVYASSNISLEHNISHDNRYHGFAILHGGHASRFIGNESHHNDRAGFYLAGTDDNSLRDNEAHDNGFDGIVLFEARHNRIENNWLRQNDGFGLFRDDASGANSMCGNSFSENRRGDSGSATVEAIDSCAYTGFGPDGPCDPVFEGGPNMKDPESIDDAG